MFRLDRSNALCLDSRCIHVIFKNIIRFARTTKRNYYEILGLKSNCTIKEIRDSFAKLSKESHPDASEGKGDPAQFQNVMEAYRVLSKKDTRAEYDAQYSKTERYSEEPWEEPYANSRAGRAEYADFRRQEGGFRNFFYNARDKFFDDMHTFKIKSHGTPRYRKYYDEMSDGQRKLLWTQGKYIFGLFCVIGLIEGSMSYDPETDELNYYEELKKATALAKPYDGSLIMKDPYQRDKEAKERALLALDLEVKVVLEEGDVEDG